VDEKARPVVVEQQVRGNNAHNQARIRNAFFQIDDVEITLAKDIRYLGVQLSSVLGFRKHIQTVSDKSMRTASRLCRLMLNVGGPIAEKRKLLTTVVHLQYCCTQHRSGAMH